MKQAVQDLFNKIFEPTCPICLKQYEDHNLPTTMCPNHHTCCQDCMKLYASSKIKCSVIGCTKDMYSFKRPPIQTFKNALKYHKQILDIFQSHQKYYLQKINLDQQSQQKAIQIFLKAEQQFIKQNFSQALALCKESIKMKPNEWPNFKFLGHPRQFWLCNPLAYVSCYQNHMKRCEQRSVYDLLNLCLALSNSFKENQQWLLEQFHKRIVIKQIAMGLGILYYAHGKDEKGEQYFSLTCKFSKLLQNEILAFLFSNFKSKQFQHTSQDINGPKQIIFIKFMQSLKSCRLIYQQQKQQRIELVEKKQYFEYQVNLQLQQKFKKFVHLNRQFYPTYYILGKIYLSLGQYQQAITYLQTYLKYVKVSTVNQQKTKIFLSYAYSMLPNCPADKLQIGINYANAYKSKNIKYDNWNTDLYWLLAKLYKQKNDLPGCKVYLERYQNLKGISANGFLSNYPQNEKERQNMSKYELLKAQVYKQQNKYQQAIVHYQKYISMMDNDIKVKEQYTEVLLNSNNLEKAHSIYEKYYFKSAKLLFEFGRKYCERQEDIKAINFFMKAFKIDPKYQEDTQVLGYICLILKDAERYQEALYWTQIWSEIQPTNTTVMRTLGNLYLKMAESKETAGKPRKIIHTSTFL